MKSWKRAVLKLETLENRLQPGSILLSPPWLSLWEPTATETPASSSQVRNLLDDQQTQSSRYTGRGLDLRSDAQAVSVVQTTTPTVQPAAQDGSQALIAATQAPPVQTPQMTVVNHGSALPVNLAGQVQVSAVPAVSTNDAAPATPNATVARNIADQIQARPVGTQQDDGATTQSLDIYWGWLLGTADNDTLNDVATINNGDGTYDSVHVGTVSDGAGLSLCLATRWGPTGADDLKWANVYGDNSACNGVAVDGAGNIYAAGTFNSGGTNDAAVLMLDGAGDVLNAVAFDGLAGLDDVGNGVDVSPDGADIALVGAFGQASGNNNGFCIRLDSGLGLVSVGTENPDLATNLNAVSLDNGGSGKAYVVGNTNPDGPTNPLLRHYDMNGDRILGTRWLALGNFEDVHFSGNVYAGGWIGDTQDGAFIASTVAGDTTPDGIVWAWSFTFGTNNTRIYGSRLESSGAYFSVAGVMNDGVEDNVFVGLFDAAAPEVIVGDVFWVIGGAGNQRAHGLALDGLDDAYASGSTDEAGNVDMLGLKYRILPV